ncbi:hypothetical protein HDV05_003517 [Chytridiales sp. JEL 0842]|nr:hypothetical protein HDV05_003517 [Chytridiales sp. JEL 0842]
MARMNPKSAYSQMYTVIEHPSTPLRFIITDCPSNESLQEYISVFDDNKVGFLIRLCEPIAYDTTPVKEYGIVVRDDMAFEDGTVPPDTVLKSFRTLLDSILTGTLPLPPSSSSSTAATQPSSTPTTTDSPSTTTPQPDTPTSTTSSSSTPYGTPRGSITSIKPSSGTEFPSIAIHCVSGIGRAPILVAVALVDAGVDPVDAVEYIRKRRRGAFNKNQLAWILDSKNGLKRVKKSSGGGGGLFTSSRRGSTDSVGVKREKSKGMLATLFGKRG